MSVASAEGEQAAGDGTDRCAVLAVPPTYADPACHTCGRYSATTSAGVARTRVPSCRTTSTPPSDPTAPTAWTGRPASACSALGRNHSAGTPTASRLHAPIRPWPLASPHPRRHPPNEHQGPPRGSDAPQVHSHRARRLSTAAIHRTRPGLPSRRAGRAGSAACPPTPTTTPALADPRPWRVAARRAVHRVSGPPGRLVHRLHELASTYVG